MNVNDLLALNEQTLAFETIMKGKLKTEMDMCKEALEKLRAGRDIVAMQEFNEREKQRLDEYRLSMESQFNEEQKTLNEKEAAVKLKEEKATIYAEELQVKERAILRTEKNKQKDLDMAVEEYQRNMSNLREEQRLLKEQQKELLLQEQQIDRKMAAIKAFA